MRAAGGVWPEARVSDSRSSLTSSPAPRVSRARSILFRVVALVGSLAVALVATEWVLSWAANRRAEAGLAAAVRDRRGSIAPLYENTPGGLRLRRFLDLHHVDPISNRGTHIRTNALGYRGDAVGPKAPGELRILVLGDSITLAAYCEESETYPSQLEQRLVRPDRPVRVINAGVAGASLREYLLIFNETGRLTQPDWVVVGLFLNDAQQSRNFPIPQGLAAHSEIARRLAEHRYTEQVRDEAPREYERLSGRFYPTTQYAPDAWRHDRAAFEAQIALNALDWGAAWFSWAWEEMRPDLDGLRGLAVHDRFRLFVVLFPCTMQVEAEFLDDQPQRYFERLLAELGIRHLDLLPAFRAAYRKSGRSLAYDHCHLTPQGNALAAEELARALALGARTKP